MPPWRALFLIQQSGLDTEQNVRGMDIGYMTVKFYHTVLAKKISRKEINPYCLLLIVFYTLYVLILHDNLNCSIHLNAFIVNP